MIIKAKKLKEAVREGEAAAEKACKCSPVWKCEYSCHNTLYKDKGESKMLFDNGCAFDFTIPLIKLAIIGAVSMAAMSALVLCMKKKCKAKSRSCDCGCMQ